MSFSQAQVNAIASALVEQVKAATLQIANLAAENAKLQEEAANLRAQVEQLSPKAR